MMGTMGTVLNINDTFTHDEGSWVRTEKPLNTYDNYLTIHDDDEYGIR